MILSVAQRIGLLQVLPSEGNYVTFKIINDLKNELALSEQEIKDYEMKIENKPDGRSLTMWNKSKEVPKEVFIGDKAGEIIKEALEKIEKSGKLDPTTFDLYEKFVIQAEGKF